MWQQGLSAANSIGRGGVGRDPRDPSLLDFGWGCAPARLSRVGQKFWT